MKRFFMAVADAVKLCIEASSESEGGDICVLKMRPLLVADLISVLIEELSLRYGYDSSRIEIEVIGLNPGEKISEVLITGEEALYAIERPGYFRIPVSGALKTKRISSSNGIHSPYETQTMLTKPEITKMLLDAGVLAISSP
jgi:FlaA1/EpsC-like NDP-sugar epimerase